MIKLLNIWLSDWNKYYNGIQITRQYLQQRYLDEHRPIDPATSSLYVCDSTFTNVFGFGNGGAIRCSSIDQALIEKSIFNNCYALSYGAGGVIDSVCSYGCYTSGSYGQFCRIQATDEGYNYIVMSSVCSTPQKDGYRTIDFVRGKQLCESVNASYNNVKQDSGLGCLESFESVPIKHCTFCFNEASAFVLRTFR